MIEINRNPSRRDLRLFSGVWTPLFTALAGVVSYWRGDMQLATTIWIVGGAASLVGLASVSAARWIYLALSYATFPIGFVVSYVVLALVFYAIVTPFGLVMRAAGRDVLRLRRPADGSLWIPRREFDDVQRHFRQF